MKLVGQLDLKTRWGFLYQVGMKISGGAKKTSANYAYIYPITKI